MSMTNKYHINKQQPLHNEFGLHPNHSLVLLMFRTKYFNHPFPCHSQDNRDSESVWE